MASWKGGLVIVLLGLQTQPVIPTAVPNNALAYFNQDSFCPGEFWYYIYIYIINRHCQFIDAFVLKYTQEYYVLSSPPCGKRKN
jgi:hypothetical protein